MPSQLQKKKKKKKKKKDEKSINQTKLNINI